MFIEVAPVLFVQLQTELVDDRALQVRSLSLCVKDNWVARILLRDVSGAGHQSPSISGRVTFAVAITFLTYLLEQLPCISSLFYRLPPWSIH